MLNYDLSNVNALVVEDQDLMRYLLAGILRQLGLNKVVASSDGESAIRALKKFTPDVIFTDYRMEPMDGFKLVKTVRAGHTPVERFVPIVLVTAYTSAREIVRARDLGVTEFLAKPISVRLVYLRLCSIIEHPRMYVSTGEFFGPDRRRRELANFEKNKRKRPFEYSEGAPRGAERT